MQDWFGIIGRGSELPASAIQDLRDVGFVVIPCPVAPNKLAQLATAYDSAVASANPADVAIGSTTNRVRDFVNRGSELRLTAAVGFHRVPDGLGSPMVTARRFGSA